MGDEAIWELISRGIKVEMAKLDDDAEEAHYALGRLQCSTDADELGTQGPGNQGPGSYLYVAGRKSCGSASIHAWSQSLLTCGSFPALPQYSRSPPIFESSSSKMYVMRECRIPCA